MVDENVILAAALCGLLASPATALEFSTVNGHGGVPLVVVQTGNQPARLG